MIDSLDNRALDVDNKTSYLPPITNGYRHQHTNFTKR